MNGISQMVYQGIFLRQNVTLVKILQAFCHFLNEKQAVWLKMGIKKPPLGGGGIR